MSLLKLVRSFAVAAVLLLSTGTAAKECNVKATNFFFGSYDPMLTTPTEARGDIRVKCKPGISYMVYLSAGVNSGESFFPRRMKHQSLPDLLNYNLYLIGTGMWQVWGDGTDGSAYVLDSSASHKWQRYTYLGRIFAGQKVNAGLYTDTITVTVQF